MACHFESFWSLNLVFPPAEEDVVVALVLVVQAVVGTQGVVVW